MKTLFKKLIILVTFISMGSLQVNAQEDGYKPINDWIPVIEKLDCSKDIKNDIIEILRQFPEEDAIGEVSALTDYSQPCFQITVEPDSCCFYNMILLNNKFYLTCLYNDKGAIVNAFISDIGGEFWIGDYTPGASIDQSLYLNVVADDKKTKSFLRYPDGTWVKESEYEGTTNYAAFTVPGATTALDILKRLIKSRTFPNIQLIDHGYAEAYVYKGTELVNVLRSDERKEFIAKLEQSKKDKEVEAQKQKEAEKAYYQELCQNYGKKYVDACQRGQLIIGTPEELFALVVFSGAMKRVNNATLSSETGRRKTYKLYGPTVYNTSSRTTFTNGFVGWATFTNGKLTSISWK